MLINNLDLTNFRNYNHFFIEFNKDINILIGKNGVGKTNLIEAIYLLSLGRTFKSYQNKQMITFNQDFTKVKGEVISVNKKHHLEMIISNEFKKAKIDGKDIYKISDYVGYLNVVIFIPDDLNIVKGSPSNRRKFLNLELSKISPIYLYNMSSYHKLLKERNKYLKMVNKYDDYLLVLDEQLAKLQVDLINRRKEFINKLSIEVNKIYSIVSNNKETIKLDYDCFIDEVSIERILEIYRKGIKRDLKYAMTNAGIHKDDISILINDKNASDYASQGQQRTIVLALKIGLIELIKNEIGEYPVLLLDDVLSELDDDRKTLLLDLLHNNIQTFITTTSIDGIDHQIVRKARKIYIKEEKGINNG